MQIPTAEPRTTLVICVAVPRFDGIPRVALVAAGFEQSGRHEHSDTWRTPGNSPAALRTALLLSGEDVGITQAVTLTEMADVTKRYTSK